MTRVAIIQASQKLIISHIPQNGLLNQTLHLEPSLKVLDSSLVNQRNNLNVSVFQDPRANNIFLETLFQSETRSKRSLRIKSKHQ